MKLLQLNHRFSLEKGSKKFPCPACGKRRFVRYVDHTTGQYLSEQVGRCDREFNCGYHYPPKEWLATKGLSYNNSFQPNNFQSSKQSEFLPPSLEYQCFLPSGLVAQSQKEFAQNNFVHFLKSLFQEELAMHLVEKFHIGTARKWNGATVFWQIDEELRAHAGKVMLFDPVTGCRVKSPYNHIDWVHSILERSGKLSNFRLQQCLFGLHQLSSTRQEKTIAIVESEKTAILMTAVLPACTWLACGGLHNLKIDQLQGLDGQNILLYPDLGAYEKWRQKAEELTQHGLKVNISDLLERNAAGKDRENGYDLADFLIKKDGQFGWALTDNAYPIFWDELQVTHQSIK